MRAMDIILWILVGAYNGYTLSRIAANYRRSAMFKWIRSISDDVPMPTIETPLADDIQGLGTMKFVQGYIKACDHFAKGVKVPKGER